MPQACESLSGGCTQLFRSANQAQKRIRHKKLTVEQRPIQRITNLETLSSRGARAEPCDQLSASTWYQATGNNHWETPHLTTAQAEQYLPMLGYLRQRWHTAEPVNAAALAHGRAGQRCEVCYATPISPALTGTTQDCNGGRLPCGKLQQH